MSEGTYGIRGSHRPDGLVDKTVNIPYVKGMPMRVNIATLAKEPSYREQWTLFVLALEKFKDTPVKEKLSYFRVAGIHLAPNKPWDGAPGPPHPSDGHIVGGYCFHNGFNFPTWHRPYMLLFEQLIWENMKAVIQHWVDDHGLSRKDEDKWRSAADAWRLPYWDWAAHQRYTENFALPEVLVQGPVRIYPPASLKRLYPPSGLYPNPFWGFDNPERDENGDPLPFGNMPDDAKDWNIPASNGVPWDQATGTSRYGVFREALIRSGAGAQGERTYRGLEGVNNGWQANAILAGMSRDSGWYDPGPPDSDEDVGARDKKREWKFTGPGTLSDAVSRMLSPGYHKYWEQFSSTKWYGKDKIPDHPTGYLSLEYIHNNIHNNTGGSNWDLGMGHMADVHVAAFDPVFWLHHCQVDRLFAIWQALNWDHWWDGPESKGNDGDDNSDDHPDDRWTHLQPFHMKDNDPRKTTYTSDKCRNWTKLNYTYDDLAAAAFGNVKKDGTLNEEGYKKTLRRLVNKMYPGSANVVTSIRKDPVFEAPAGLVPSHDELIGHGGGQWKDYIINIVYDRYALQGSPYSIEFYLGTSLHPRNFVGSVYTFSNSQGESCPNCTSQQEAGVLSRGQVPLTLHLLHHVTDSVDDHPLDSYLDHEVEEYLQNHLQWKFVRYGGKEEPASLFTKTQVKVLRGQGELHVPDESSLTGDGDHIPVFSGYHVLPNATAGKSWGLHHVEGSSEVYGPSW